ncbi:MAG TPA: DUF374 domain-containing protein [Parachlamydiaceae bacterium]|nr:DUF374 domain-containing protein [Parachlamydiaceae bacterium]
MLKALKRKIFAFFIAYIGKFGLRLILSTCKVEIKGFKNLSDTIRLEKCILMLWHNRLSIVSEILYRLDKKTVFSAFISKSRDGDPLAKLAGSYKTGKAIRVPHNQRHQALKSVIDTLKNSQEVVIMTPDGPKGPRYEVKPGIVAAAKETNASIIPFTWISTKFWQLNSWDKLLFPKPFSTVVVTFGKALKLDKNDTMEKDQLFLKENLLALETCNNQSFFESLSDWPK